MKTNKQTEDAIAAIYARDGPTIPFRPEYLHFTLTIYFDMLITASSGVPFATCMTSVKSRKLLEEGSSPRVAAVFCRRLTAEPTRWCTTIQLDPAILKPKRRLLMSSAFGEPTRWAMRPKNDCDHKNTRRDEKYSTCLDCNRIAPLMQRCAFCSKPFEIPNGVWECHVEDNFCCMYCALACLYGEEIATIWTMWKEFRECIWAWDYKLLGITENLWFGPFVLTYDPVINWAIFWNHPEGWRHPISIPTRLMHALDQIGHGQFRQALKTLFTRSELAVASSSIERTV